MQILRKILREGRVLAGSKLGLARSEDASGMPPAGVDSCSPATVSEQRSRRMRRHDCGVMSQRGLPEQK